MIPDYIQQLTVLQTLQYDLCNVYKWTESNNMKFNSKKFQYINLTVSPQCNTSNVHVSADSN